jgi:putative peptidoglycan lipid II flippase
MGPAILAASAVQVNVLVNSAFASHLEAGAVSWLDWAFRFLQLPIGVFGVAVATVTLPRISADAANEDFDAFRSNLSRGIRLALALTVPCTAGLILLAEPIISLVYGHGRMSAFDVDMTAIGLRAYVMGLAAYAVIKVLTPAFYAIDMKNLPMIVGFISIGVNFFLNYFLAFTLGLGHVGLALSTGLVAVTNLSILYFMMRHRLGRLDTKALARSLLQMAAATAVLSGICLLGLKYLIPLTADANIFLRAATLLPLIGAAGAAYLAIALLLGLDELKLFFDAFLRKIRRGSQK